MKTDTGLEQHILNKKNIRLHYYLSAPINKKKETIVLLHPAFSDHTCFKGQLQLTEDFNLVLVDLPGHGNSHAIKGSMAGVDEVINFLAEIFTIVIE